MAGAIEKRVIFTNDLDELSRIRDEIQDFIGDCLEYVERNRVILAMDEAIANIIKYGYPNGGRGTVELVMRRDDVRLEFVLTDDAVPFNPLELPDADLEHYHNTGASGGLGVYLYRRLMDVSYEPTPSGGNRLTLSRRINEGDS
ncbi:MAG TPA: ATP-binding protein [Spirochaetota bacterium]|nr:ATP-binding protein [Spirochaetota bacterium]HPI22380.1 ATP-binding protein [Spirochaetota bacterium]HPU87005.1 ATP-binding protein [Spirochaetota bacterium]